MGGREAQANIEETDRESCCEQERSGVRSAMHTASQLTGKGSTDVDDAPAPARLIKNLIMIYDEKNCPCFFFDQVKLNHVYLTTVSLAEIFKVLDIASTADILVRQRTSVVMISLHRCAG